MRAALKGQQLTDEWYYTTSTDLADKSISMGGVQPDTGRNVNGLKNAVSLLIETRGVGIGRMHIQRRVHTQVTAMASVLQHRQPRRRPEQAAPLHGQGNQPARPARSKPSSKPTRRPRNTSCHAGPGHRRRQGADVDWNSALALRKR
jgi:hypothetical protein